MLKKFTAFALSFFMVLLSVISAGADSADNNAETRSSVFAEAEIENAETSAESAVLYCVNDGKAYYSKNENKKMKNASTTKIMTALITLEYAQKDNKQVEFTKDMEAEGSSMYLEQGDVVTLHDLASGMMSCSGNDGANAAAISIAGSAEKFAELMNQRAKQIGMKNTHFVTPSGLDDDNHYSTAYDLALLMSYAMENSDFAEIAGAKSTKVDFISPEGKSMTYTNHNRLLSSYPYCIGGKTGYTQSAGRCLVSVAEKDGLRYVCVTLNDKNDWKDHTNLYDTAFEHFRFCSCDERETLIELPVAGGEEDTVTVGCERHCGIVLNASETENITKTVYLENFCYAPIKEGDNLGRITFESEGRIVAEFPITAFNTVL